MPFLDRALDSGQTILSEQWLGLLDLLKISAFTIDQQLRVTSCNQCARALLGVSESEIVGHECREVFRGISCAASCPFQESSPLPREINVELLDAEDRPHSVTRLTAPIYDSAREVVGYLVLLQDRFSLSEILDRMQYGEKSLKIVLDNLDLAIFTVNRGGYVTFFNDAAESLTGFSREQVLGKPCDCLFGPASKHIWRALRPCLKHGRSGGTGPTKIFSSHGEILDVKIDFMPLTNEQEKLVGGLVTLHDLALARKLDQVVTEQDAFQGVIGRDPQMQRIFEIVEQVASTDITVLIEGATGTGKDLLAQAIHSASQRSERPLVKVNCAALPHELLESEMFGYIKGAFTGAYRDKPGRFQEADGGTIFLDEISELPLSLQGKLLRVLEDKEFYPLGGCQVISVDVRILAATNSNLVELMERRLFREDLFYRLNVCQIRLPSLQERQSDLPLLIWHILRRLAGTQGVRTPEISVEAMDILLGYHYPGNIRELENILKYALLICKGKTIEPRHLQPSLFSSADRRQRCPSARPLGAREKPGTQERQRILEALERNNWRKKSTAAELGMDRSTLWRKMRKYGLRS